MGEESHELTELLKSWGAGDKEALNKLTPLLYRELHRTAKIYMARQQSDHTLQTTALVNEVYLRLVDFGQVRWDNRTHFLALCAKLMRRILTDWARSKHYLKRGKGAPHLSLEECLIASPERNGNLLALHDALNALSEVASRKAQVVELRFYGGLSVEETADILKISPVTVMRDWKVAKLWLLREMSGG